MKSGRSLYRWRHHGTGRDLVHTYTDFDDRYVATTFMLSGKQVIARPKPEDRDIAWQRGYSIEEWELCSVEHDTLHSLVAYLRGQAWSPTLYYVAHGYDLNEPRIASVIADEEWLIAEFTKLVNGMKSENLETGRVPWAVPGGMRSPVEAANHARSFLRD